MRMTTRIGTVAGLAAAAALGLGLGTSGAVAAPATGQPDSAASSQAAEAQVAANTVAEAMVSAVSAGRLGGFAGIEVDPSAAHPGVIVFWHGGIPARLRETAARAGTAAASGSAAGVAVTFRPAPYTQDQLNGLENTISSAQWAQAGISSMGFYPQATGIWIGVDTRADLARVRRLPTLEHTAIPVHYFVSPTVPLTLSAPAAPAAAAAPVPGRYKDEPPFNGGDFIETKYAGHTFDCSSGFGMHYANKKRAPWFMLTAAHCMAYSELTRQRFWIQGNGKDVGVTYYWTANNDTVSLYMASPYGVRGAGGGNHIYVGNTSMKNSRGQSEAAVKGSAAVFAKDNVSTSGAWSGERTRIQVQTTTWRWSAATLDGHSYFVFGARAIKKNHTNAAGHGDSGGPVFINVKGGVKAVGIISATSYGSHKAPCTGIVEHRTCYWDFNFALMTGTATSIESEMNLTVNVAK
jgi:hypothetical protein